MTDQAIAIAPAEPIVFEPQDRKPVWTVSRVLSTALSVLVIGAALYQLSSVSMAEIMALLPTSPLFWAVFAVSYLTGTASEWVIFRRLWHIGPRAFGALMRKLIYNEMLFGYLGEVYFYTWARKHLTLVASPFGAVKDVAVLSAVAGNVMTLVFLAIAFPVLRLLPLHEHTSAIAWSLAFVISISLGAVIWRGKIFSLDRSELTFVAVIHFLRILATTALSALLWHLVLPETPLVWWLVLATIRLLISRLPFVPNKDVVFASVAVLALGHEVELSALMAMMAGLILATHILVGVSLALADLIQGDRHAQATG